MKINLLKNTISFFALVAVTAGCSMNPVSGSPNLVLSRSSTEFEKGREEYEVLNRAGALYESQKTTLYVASVGQKLVSVSDAPNDKFTFSVLDDPGLNASAHPGGFIYITRGLLAHINSEDELAFVLAHEIGHVIARHYGRKKTTRGAFKTLSEVTGFLTGSRELRDAAIIYGAQLSSGFSREMELEADGLGVKYLKKAGYRVDAALSSLTTLKNHEMMIKNQLKNSGDAYKVYHGLYSTHPRKDKRLQEVIRTASQLEDAEVENLVPPEPLRTHLDGLVWGDSIQSKREENRFYHNKLGFTFAHPENWTVETRADQIIAEDPGKMMSLSLTLSREPKEQTPQAFLESQASGSLNEGKTLDNAGLTGYTAVASANGTSKRLAVIYFKGLAYRFEGTASDFSSGDSLILPMIESFRPIHPTEKAVGDGYFVEFIQFPRGVTLASLAANSSLPNAEDQLRLINGLYPEGEPRVGDWIKIIRE